MGLALPQGVQPRLQCILVGGAAIGRTSTARAGVASPWRRRPCRLAKRDGLPYLLRGGVPDPRRGVGELGCKSVAAGPLKK